MPTHIIHFAGPINITTAERIRDTCLDAVRQGATEIRLHFSSDGGSNFYGFTLYNFMRSLPIPLVIHNLGNVESMAVIVFLAGSRRLVCPQARFLIHSLHWGFPNGAVVDHARFREHVATLDDDLQRFAEIFDARTAGAQQPIDIRNHLLGPEKLLRAADRWPLDLHMKFDAAIPNDAVTWWVSAS